MEAAVKDQASEYEQRKDKATDDDAASPIQDNLPVSERELKQLWQKYAEKVKQEGRNVDYILMNQQIRLLPDMTIDLPIANSLQADTLEKFKPELMGFLRQQLQNNSLQIKTTLIEDNKKRMVYTPKEKFNYLADKHPLLRELQQKLGLDTDY